MIHVAIAGAAGRMGRQLLDACSRVEGIRCSVASEHPDSPFIGADAGEIAGIGRLGIPITAELAPLVDRFDLLIDFTKPAVTIAHLALCRSAGKAMVIGTTGLSTEQKAEIAAGAARIPIVFAPNMSVGVNLCLKLLELAARTLGDSVDIEILEAHHRHKVDAPSGTALAMGQTIAGVLGRDWRNARCTAGKASPASATATPSVSPPSGLATSSATIPSCSPTMANASKSPTAPPAG